MQQFFLVDKSGLQTDASVPHNIELSTEMTYCFFLVVSHGLSLGRPDPLLAGTSVSSSTLSAVDLFCRFLIYS